MAGKKSGKGPGVERKNKRTVKSSVSEMDPITASLMDLSVPLYPLASYVSDRSELVDQVFKSLTKDDQLEKLLPDVLRDIPMDELKYLCVQQLEVMSKKRIKKILSGEEMESSSGTDDSDVNGEEESSLVVQPSKIGDQNSENGSEKCGEKESSTAESRDDDMLELHAENTDDEMLTEEKEKTQNIPEQKSKPCEAVMADDEEDEELKLPGFNIQSMQLSQPSVTIAKTCMEILELELRARAIKALLKSQTTSEDQPQ